MKFEKGDIVVPKEQSSFWFGLVDPEGEFVLNSSDAKINIRGVNVNADDFKLLCTPYYLTKRIREQISFLEQAKRKTYYSYERRIEVISSIEFILSRYQKLQSRSYVTTGDKIMFQLKYHWRWLLRKLGI